MNFNDSRTKSLKIKQKVAGIAKGGMDKVNFYQRKKNCCTLREKEEYRIVFAVILFLCCTLKIFAQTIDTTAIDRYIQYFEEKNGGIGTLSLFKDGAEVYNRSFGQQNLGGAFDLTTRYNIGSVTKMITATLIFKLTENGKLQLDDKLSGFFPSAPNADNITIKQMLEHTSGLGDYTVKDDKLWLDEDVNDSLIFDEIKKQGVLFEPGERIHYSNTAYYLLTKIVEQKYEDSFSSIVHRELVLPLNLKTLESSQYNVTNVYPLYAFANCKWEKAEDLYFAHVVGVGDIVSTPTDLNIFIASLFRCKILNHSNMELMKPQENEVFGRGLMIWPYKNMSFFGSGGDTSCTHSFAFYNEDDDIAIAFSLITNRYRHKSFAKDIMDIIYMEKIWNFLSLPV